MISEINIISPPRTGSTLIYNIIKFLFPECKINKTHKIFNYNPTKFNHNPNIFYIFTIRHPYNSVISDLLIYDLAIDNNIIKNAANNYMDHGGKIVIDNINYILNEPDIITLVYEKFINNFDYIFQIIENKFKIKIKLSHSLIPFI